VGLTPVEPDIDFDRVMAHVRGARDRIAPHDSPQRLRREGVEVIQGQARFVGPGRIAVDGREIAYRTALIATGSRPLLLPLEGLDEARPVTTETVWDLGELPGRLLVLGGGPTGCELGQAFARLGSAVTLVEMADFVLRREEPEARDLVAEQLRADGVDVRLSTRAVRVEGNKLVVEQADKRESLSFDRILVTVGRRAATEGLGLETVSVETREDGSVVVDDTLRTSGKGIFAAGDVVGGPRFTHVAAYHSRLAVMNALFHLRRRLSYRAVPWATFTDPEIGRVGLSEAQARQRWGDDAKVWRFDYSELDRAICAGQAYGFAKLVGDQKGRLVGATVAAPAGGEAIAELAAWAAQGGRLDDVSQTMHTYPTFAGGPARAADHYLREKWLTERVRTMTRPVLALLRWLERPHDGGRASRDRAGGG
ncbi:MAG: FAD-dependent oxidoreductase, partial [Actinomycetota bacterium]|nr:FAD-dependent oxidoreductase [Actinomycetota bacterium]